MSSTTLAWDEEALQRLEKIPAFVRPMAKNKIEKAARDAGECSVTVAFMDTNKAKLMGS
ncbi:PCP reductase family protein [Mariprofundus ferrooxydans]|uniref:PCP reductase family protein n=1 Tax=Mariprofundus ferrooxydans TaxID=314344 RepID=UPI0014317812|nr:PCP reductase family protein [Mariprofundus ferrooxydans]